MRKLGIDYGSKYIGLAVSDRSNTIAHSKEVIKRTDLKKDLATIKDYISDYEIDEIVVGMPTSLNGTRGPRAEKTQQFINFLNNHLDIEVTVWDERFTTLIADQSMIDADISRRKRKKMVDKIAAALILQNYLDYLNQKDGEEDE
ncbi:MAG TPA: Holliday junction resolvase RuvX [Halanaerobiales bacterium]|nr:Holliday junction resolvase RuvX [Halanaerobiales bacterium]